MKKIIKTDLFNEKLPEFKGAAISADVINSTYDDLFWSDFEQLLQQFAQNNNVEDVNKRVTIKATRDAYKTLGKEPNRYRPSAEALCRRIVKEKSLYKINTLVDIINYVSIETGYSIGGFDEEKINGDILTLDKGRKEDIFNAIGRGLLNIENLPIYKDNTGGIGTPTSDEERTKISINTKKILILINAYSGNEGLDKAISLISNMLIKYASASNINISYF